MDKCGLLVYGLLVYGLLVYVFMCHNFKYILFEIYLNIYLHIML
jgi:hypothetical protein